MTRIREARGKLGATRQPAVQTTRTWPEQQDIADFSFIVYGDNRGDDQTKPPPRFRGRTQYMRGLDLGGGIGGIIYQKKGSDYYYYHYNHKGDVVALTDGNGELAAFYEYDAWGNTMTEAEKSGVDNPYRYSTKEWDEKSGLYYFGARYYCADTGRWMERDPAGIVDGLNLYAYVSNDPVSHVDPEGRKTKPTLTYQQEKLRRDVHYKCNLSRPKDMLDNSAMDQCCDALVAFFIPAVEAYPFAAIPVRNAYEDCTNIAQGDKCHSGGWLVNRFFGHLRKKKSPRNLRDAWEEFLDYAWGKVFVSPRPRHPIRLPRR